MDQFDVCAYAAILVARGALLDGSREGDLIVAGLGQDFNAIGGLVRSGVVKICGIEIDVEDD
jgi:hypothetical protein